MAGTMPASHRTAAPSPTRQRAYAHEPQPKLQFADAVASSSLGLGTFIRTDRDVECEKNGARSRPRHWQTARLRGETDTKVERSQAHQRAAADFPIYGYPQPQWWMPRKALAGPGSFPWSVDSPVTRGQSSEPTARHLTAP